MLWLKTKQNAKKQGTKLRIITRKPNIFGSLILFLACTRHNARYYLNVGIYKLLSSCGDKPVRRGKNRTERFNLKSLRGRGSILRQKSEESEKNGRKLFSPFSRYYCPCLRDEEIEAQKG